MFCQYSWVILVFMMLLQSSSTLRVTVPWISRSILPISRSSGRFASTGATSVSPTQVQKPTDEGYMKLALRHAQHAYREREVPIGAVVVNETTGEIIAAGRNEVETLQDATAHAEINALRKAAKIHGNWRLSNCTLYTTLEPCSMCFSAIQSFRIKRVVFAAKDLRLGACGTWINLADSPHPFHPAIEVKKGVLEEESATLLKRFFQTLRQEKKQSAQKQIDTINKTNNVDRKDNRVASEEEMCGRGYTNHFS